MKSRMLMLLGMLLTGWLSSATAQKKPNIIILMSDDTGWGDLGPYGGGEGRGAPTPSFDQMAREGMLFWDFYGQPSCTPGRAAAITGRIPNRSGMTTVAFPGDGGGLPKEEWTLASVLKTAGYATFFAGKWHLGEADYAMPIAHGFDVMKNVTLYHLNAYTYADPKWNADMPAALRDRWAKGTKGALEGEAGKGFREVKKIDGSVIPYLDETTENESIKWLEQAAKGDKPFFMEICFAKNHQPNLPHPDFVNKSTGKNKYADCVVELDTRVGQIMEKIRSLGIAENTLVVYTVDNGTWQDVYPDCGYTPFRGTKGTVREGGNRIPTIMWWPGTIKAGSQNHDILGSLDFMATFASLAGVSLPQNDRGGKPIIFDSYDMSMVLKGTGKSKRTTWMYFTENELSPGAIRISQFKAVFNLRGDGGQATGGLAVDANLGWKGEEKYVATASQIFDLWQDPQERYDLFMNNFTEKTWFLPNIQDEITEFMKTYAKYPPRKLQSNIYTGPITITDYERLEIIKEKIKNYKVGTGGGM
ncbi:arylsulfatase [Chitinophaga sp. ARDCPP14]|uniref:arylsulfatase n=1 Tax=Chitinophaga sp. ARDCPP14 TaxID=3391139 RepID=UPI003F52089F